MKPERHGFLTGVVDAFLGGNLSILVIIVSLAMGVTALLLTPREEEPQIVVPVADILISVPGASAEEVEQLVASRLERMLQQIAGVEYVYSASRPGEAVVTVRFFVGEDREASLIKLYNQIQQNLDRVTPGIAGWLVKPIEIDDVPIVMVTLYSPTLDSHALHRVAEEVAHDLERVRNSARITLHGGAPRQVQVYLDPERLGAYRLSPGQIAGALQATSHHRQSGAFEQADTVVAVETGTFFQHADEVANALVGLHEGRPVYLRDVAEIRDGSAEAETYSRFLPGPAADPGPGGPAVTIAVAKKQGSNAVTVARDVHRAMEEMAARRLPEDVRYAITRDYGETANDKVNNLVQSLGLAILTVIALIALTMGWRPAIIIALAVPLTYSLTLMINLWLGFTINRVTLFALILALGLLVDDPIVGVENIYRHLQGCAPEHRRQRVLHAMTEVMPPIVLSTLAIIASFLPMLFITGMMGPYMRPMAYNVPLAIVMSTVVALTVTPWVASRVLRQTGPAADAEARDIHGTRSYRMYARVVAPLLDSKARARILLAVMAGLFGFSVLLALTGRVPLKMLPFDNKNELQVLVDLPEGSTLEATDAAVRDLEAFLQTVPEVTGTLSLVGAATPIDFNGLVRQYYLRQGPHLADLRLNLVHHTRRRMGSHAIGLRLRSDLREIADRHGAVVKLVEVPPGPPVLATVVAEVTGEPHHHYEDLIAAARIVKGLLAEEDGVVDLDDSVEAAAPRVTFVVDREKAGRSGISTADVAAVMETALQGTPVGILHEPGQRNEVPIVLRVSREQRSGLSRLRALPVQGRDGQVVSLGELGEFREDTREPTIFHKNQERVVYVTAEMAGRGPAYAVLGMGPRLREADLPPGIRASWRGEGEWKITLDVFRDLGIAFAAALVGIYVLLVYETGSFALPGVIMLSIPLSLIGIMPGFWLINAIADRPVGGYGTPVYFTATAMIGMIALSGIVVRNGIILIDFVRTAVREGAGLRQAILDSGAVRARPIFLTATTTVLGAWPITLDPIFSGLAWAIIFGMFVSTAFTLVVIPVVYNLMYGGTCEVREEEKS